MTHPSYSLPHADMSNAEWIRKRNEVEKKISRYVYDYNRGANVMLTKTGVSNEIMNILVGTVPAPPPINLQDSVSVKQGDQDEKERGFLVRVHGEPLSKSEALDLITDIREHLDYAQKVSK